jgi:hypothetical protein
VLVFFTWIFADFLRVKWFNFIFNPIFQSISVILLAFSAQKLHYGEQQKAFSASLGAGLPANISFFPRNYLIISLFKSLYWFSLHFIAIIKSMPNSPNTHANLGGRSRDFWPDSLFGLC